MAIRDLGTVDGISAVEVETTEQLTQVLFPGVWVRVSRKVLAECGLTETENSDPPEIVAEADWRDDAWLAQGGD